MHTEDASTKKTKDQWEQACDFFETMLDDFRSKNLLRRNINKSERERLDLVWENSRNYQTALNNWFNKFKSVGKPSEQEIKKKCADIGLPKDTVDYLFFSQLVGTFLLKLEALFRTSLLFFLEERRGIKKNLSLGPLLGKIQKISPSIGTELNSLIDTDLRNSLAHGVFWFEEGVLFLAPNSYLEKAKEMPLAKLFMENMKMTILANALVHTLKQKEENGYFES
jgi:hypothetical protein